MAGKSLPVFRLMYSLNEKPRRLKLFTIPLSSGFSSFSLITLEYITRFLPVWIPESWHLEFGSSPAALKTWSSEVCVPPWQQSHLQNLPFSTLKIEIVPYSHTGARYGPKFPGTGEGNGRLFYTSVPFIPIIRYQSISSSGSSYWCVCNIKLCMCSEECFLHEFNIVSNCFYDAK